MAFGDPAPCCKAPSGHLRAAVLGLLLGGALGLSASSQETPPQVAPPPAQQSLPQEPPTSAAVTPQDPAAPPQTPKAGGETPGPASEKKDVHWNFQWKGWDGITFKVRKALPGKDPFQDVAYLDLSQVRFEGKFGGRLGLDAAALGSLESADTQSWEVRRAAIYMAGSLVLLAPFSYRLEASVLGGHFTTEDTYIRWEHLPYVGSLKLGQYDVPFGLENSMTSFSVNFMERSTPVTALAPGRNLGIEIGRPVLHDRMTWTLGVFTAPTYQDSGDASKDFLRVTGRLTGLLSDRLDREVPECIHLGLSLSRLDSGHYGVQYQTRPEAHLAPYLVNTGQIPDGNSDQYCLEAAWEEGPVSVQGEVLGTRVSRESGPAVNFWGWYAQATWSLTGENRPYDKKGGVFRSLVPLRPFSFKHRGWGALELAARFSHVDLNDKDIHGGIMNTFTAGASWYLNANSKIMLNYVGGRVTGPVPYSRFNIVEFRIAFNI
jgi:phosphate-selective porin